MRKDCAGCNCCARTCVVNTCWEVDSDAAVKLGTMAIGALAKDKGPLTQLQGLPFGELGQVRAWRRRVGHVSSIPGKLTESLRCRGSA
jgi:hypothetical protein